MKKVRIIGVDPGTSVAGYGVLDAVGRDLQWVAHGSIRAGRSKSYARRLLHLAERLEGIIFRYSPDVMAVEKAFYGKSIRSAFTMGEGRGVIILTSARCGLEYFEYDPTQIKKSVTGNGRAQKVQVQRAVRQHLRLPGLPKPADAADALAIAICHAVSACVRRR